MFSENSLWASEWVPAGMVMTLGPEAALACLHWEMDRLWASGEMPDCQQRLCIGLDLAQWAARETVTLQSTVFEWCLSGNFKGHVFTWRLFKI